MEQNETGADDEWRIFYLGLAVAASLIAFLLFGHYFFGWF